MLVAPPDGRAVVTVGSDLSGSTGTTSCLFLPTCTAVQTALPGRPITSPIDGVVVRWRVGNGSGTLALRVIRPAPGGAFTAVGSSAPVTITAPPAPPGQPPVISTFATRIPGIAGDVGGIDLAEASSVGTRNMPGAEGFAFFPQLADNETRQGVPFVGLEGLVNADIEADSDRDGFGDETQDLCAKDASTQGLCGGPCANDRLGTEGDDVLTGTEAGDNLRGLGGNDELTALAGDDCLSGGLGTDRLTADAGNDAVDGEAGTDTLAGGLGDDRLAGGDDNDQLDGDENDDALAGGDDDDQLEGDEGDDALAGGDGDDRLGGGPGRDAISAATGNDRLNGGPGRDRLRGGAGRDRIVGGAGKDRIEVGKGANRTSGGPGRDDIRAANGRRDRIACGPGRDRVRADRNDRVRKDCERIAR